MYPMKPVYHSMNVSELPTCMYKMNNYHSHNGDVSTDSSQSEVQLLMSRQDTIISKLESLKKRIDSMTASSSSQISAQGSSRASGNLPSGPGVKPKGLTLPRDVVICCNPKTAPKTLLSVLDRLRATYKVLCTYHIHSSAKSSPCLDLSKHGFQTNLIGEGRSDKDTVITWIWKDCTDCEMVVNPVKHTKICNQVNVCRYLMRLLGDYPADPVKATKLDEQLDKACS